MKILLLILLSVASYFVEAQQLINCAGYWTGISTFGKTNYQLNVEITQNANLLEGTIQTKSLNGLDSTLSKFKGVITGDEVKLQQNEFIYKTWLSCLSDLTIKFGTEGDQKMLFGKWKGDWRLSTCPPNFSGEIRMYKKLAPLRSEGTPSQLRQTTIVDQSDQLGQVLVSELQNRKYHALIIGVNVYPDEQIVSLANPVGDARKLANVLSEYYSFEKGDIEILENPTRSNIIEAFDKLSIEVKEKDNLLIFFAGHGIWNSQLNQGYWLPSDAALNSKSQWLSNSTIRDYIGGIKSKHTLLITDACFSGGILKERAVFENSRAILELYKMPSRKAMTSGTLTTVPDKSVFIQYLLKNLENNQEILLSSDELFRQFKTAVINNSPNGQVPQYGPIAQTGDEGGDFIFMKRDLD